VPWQDLLGATQGLSYDRPRSGTVRAPGHFAEEAVVRPFASTAVPRASILSPMFGDIVGVGGMALAGSRRPRRDGERRRGSCLGEMMRECKALRRADPCDASRPRVRRSRWGAADEDPKIGLRDRWKLLIAGARRLGELARVGKTEAETSRAEDEGCEHLKRLPGSARSRAVHRTVGRACREGEGLVQLTLGVHTVTT